MDNLIDFVTNAASWLIGCLAVIGFVAVLGGIGFILYLEYKDLRGKNDEQDTDNQHGQGA